MWICNHPDSAEDSEACPSSRGAAGDSSNISGDESEGSSSYAGGHSDASMGDSDSVSRGDNDSVGGRGASSDAGGHSDASRGDGDSAGGDSVDGSGFSSGDDSEGSSSDANAHRVPLYKKTKQVHQTNTGNRLQLGSLVARIPHVTEQTLVEYSLFRHATPTKLASSRRFPPGSMARKIERAVGHITTIEWGVQGGKFRRNKMWKLVKQATLAPLALDLRSGHVMARRKKKAKLRKVAYTVLVARGAGVNPALRMGIAMLAEAQKWGLNLPEKGAEKPGTNPRSKTYMGGTQWKLPLEKQETFMGGGVSLLAATWDGRGIGGKDESTTVGLLCPSTGAGGPFALRTYQPLGEVAMHENHEAVRFGLRATMLPQAIEEVYAWEQQTAHCPVHIPGAPLALCGTCGLEKWKHYVLAAVVADGAGLVHQWFEPDEKHRSWMTTQDHPCKGCTATVPQYRDMWYRHNHYRRRPEFGAFPNDLFPKLPLFRKILCQMHTGEKIGSWAVSCVVDLLEHDHGDAHAKLLEWVHSADPTWTRWETKTQGKKEIRGDRFMAGNTTKKFFCYGSYQTNQGCLDRWQQGLDALPVLDSDVECCTSGDPPELCLQPPAANGIRYPATERIPDLLREIFGLTRQLLLMGFGRAVGVDDWVRCATQLHRLMVTGRMRPYGRRYLGSHPGLHWGLVHSADVLRAQVV